jgi:putative phage-type endonuclease
MSNYINDLEPLQDILDTIIPEEDKNTFSPEEEADIIDICIQLMTEYNETTPTAISEPDFEEDMIDDIKEILFHSHINNFFNHYAEIEEDLENIIDIALEFFYSQVMPRRSFIDTFETKLTLIEKEILIKRLNILKNIPQNTQRTKEWYETRHKLITASNAYKAFENESTRNQLIYEKCQPLQIDIVSDMLSKSEYVNTNTPMHWGQKYEPISVMYYENIFKTKVEEYGCIQHDTYKFLGASPDGIVSDPSKPRFGRMLEIKNIVNREIDGVPKKEYWIQMQLQMETCDLNECDFLETRFHEYNNYNDFKEDGDFLLSKEKKHKGVIMFFSSKEGKPSYVYKPWNMGEEEFMATWEPTQLTNNEENGLVWIKNIYWYLEEVSCVLVSRNRLWFSNNISQLQDVWNTILRERQTGCEHRAPNRRIKKDKQVEGNLNETCLLKIDKLTNKATITGQKQFHNHFMKKPNDIPIQVIKVRTESIDETKRLDS